MEVTRSNFAEVYSEVVKAIEEATFISMDSEFSGLKSGEFANRVTMVDSPAMLYSRIRQGSMDFICFQFGMAVFRLDPNTLQYSCKAYSFYTFPRPVTQFAPESSFLCQPSSIDFLVRHNFDFNKTFHNGITYMNMEQRAKFAEMLRERREKQAKRFSQASQSQNIKIPPQHAITVNNTCEKLASVLSESCETDEVRVDGCNGFIRKLVYQTIREKYDADVLCVETKDGVLISRKARTKEEEEEEMRKRELSDEQLLEEAIGFSNVIQALSKSGKLVVGHNMFLDVCHICHHFLCSLPDNYTEYKEVVSTLFPRLIDTKYIATLESMQEFLKFTQLNLVYERTAETPFSRPKIDIPEGYGFSSDDKFHDAAFDAYITGVSFISFFNYLANPKNSDVNSRMLKNSESLSPVLNSVLNRVFLMESMDTCIHFGGKDPQPDKNHIFKLEFPKSWTQQNIAQLFSPYGPVQIWWISDKSAWVGLVRRDEARKVRKAFCGKMVKDVTVETFESAAKNFLSHNSLKRHAPPPETQSKRLKADSLCQESPDQRSDGTSSRLPKQSPLSDKGNILSQLETCCTSDFGPVDQDWS